MAEKFLKVKFHGLGWKRDECNSAYEKLQKEIGNFLEDKKEYVDQLKTVSVTICQELDRLHSIEEETILLQR